MTKGEISQLATCAQCLSDDVHDAQNGEDGQVRFLQCSQLCSKSSKYLKFIFCLRCMDVSLKFLDF